jgi:hypothetical protein
MAFEILNNATITPHRLHTMILLVSRLHEPKEKDVFNWLQPVSLNKNQNTSRDVFNAARHCNLLEENSQGVISLTVDADQIASMQGFRHHMQRVLTGITGDQENNYLLNIYTAWYAVQQEQVFGFERKDFEVNFNKRVYPDSEERHFNTTKLNGWRTWAAFLGWGRVMKIRTFDILIPDATERIAPILCDLLPDGKQIIPFGTFAKHLSAACPELDGGALFNYCWQASRGDEQQGNTLSLMLSTALRVLDTRGQIALVRHADAEQLWQLFPAMGQSVQTVSHIQRRDM